MGELREMVKDIEERTDRWGRIRLGRPVGVGELSSGS